MITRRRVSACAPLLASLMVVAACSVTRNVETAPTTPTPPPTSTATTRTTRPPTTEPATTIPITTAPGSPAVFVDDPNRPPQPYDEALSAAILDIDAFWRATFPQVYGANYPELQGGIWPVYPGRRGVPGCGERETSYTEIEGNAFYCPDGDFVAFDDNDLFPGIYNRYGPEVLAMIVAHEWGHAIQNRAGIFQLPTIVLEQQADCFAGSWMAHVAVDNTLFSVNDETLNVAFSGMLTFRDSPGTTADLEGAHGSGFDRVGAFQDGYTNTASQCATYEREPPPVIELPFTTADIDNGGNLPFDQIVPLSAQDLDLYWKDLFASLGATYSAPAGGLQPYPTNGPYPSCSSLAPDADFATGRVWYCPDNDFIAYDQDALAGPVYEIGDFAASVLIGNAWSDAMLTKLHVNLSGKERSLTNDCLTGTWTRSTLPDQQTNPDRLVLSAGDLDEGVTAFLRYGAGEHGERTEEVGTVFERTASFRKGILQGVSACGIGR